MANLKVNMSMTKNEMPEQDPVVRAGNFDEVALGYDAETAQKEAARCLKCGATTVDFNKCIGCGLCTTRCEFDAIHLSRDLPAASDMHTAEEMMKLVGPYALKRMGKIIKRKITGKPEYPTEQE